MRAAPSGLRHPASASCLGRHSHLAGRCPNNSSLFPPLAAVVAVAPKGRAIGKPGHFRLTAEGPTGRKRAGAATEGSRFWTTHLVKLL